MSEYFTSDFEHPVSEEALREADRETQLDVMRTWFFRRFENPAEGTPYESREGGYIWIYGGPYDAEDELNTEFSGTIPDEVIEELVDELEQECLEWAPKPMHADYDKYLVEDIGQITTYCHNFTEAVLNIDKLLQTDVDDTVANCFYRLLYVNVITALETYLSDAFTRTVVTSAGLMRRFVETTPEFQSEKIPLSNVFKAVERIEDKARSYLIDIVWHHLARIRPMYRATLTVEFPADSKSIFHAIRIRHDLVHRNGKTKDGKEIILTSGEVRDLIMAAKTFVQHIDRQVTEVRANPPLNPDAPPAGDAPAS